MDSQIIFKPVTEKELKSLSRKDLITLILGEQDIKLQLWKVVEALEEERLLAEEKYILIRHRMFGKSSEKGSFYPEDTTPQEDAPADSNNSVEEPEEIYSESPEASEETSESSTPSGGGSGPKPPKPSKPPRKSLPSERYPHAETIHEDVFLETLPKCKCCDHEMKDSGMTRKAETLEVIPKKFVIKVGHYHNYVCRNCHGDVVTTPAVPRIKPGSSYGDSVVIDVALSKFCDLIPVDRYSAMAERLGFPDIPPNSLIEQTHYLADFLEPVYSLIKKETLEVEVIYADETPHKMLEGSPVSNWYLWGFSSKNSCFFECRSTRSGDVANEILSLSKSRYLMSDKFSGYRKAVTLTNKMREEKKLPLLTELFCNAHARRGFKEASLKYPELDFFVKSYALIYKVEKDTLHLSVEEREKMRKSISLPLFKKMKDKAEEIKDKYSSKGIAALAIKYFLNDYLCFITYIENGYLPIDNNPMERLLRPHVVGRKTWIGTHSKRGVKTAVTLYTIIESCKLVKVNPRDFFHAMVKDMLQKKPPCTPYEYFKRMNSPN